MLRWVLICFYIEASRSEDLAYLDLSELAPSGDFTGEQRGERRSGNHHNHYMDYNRYQSDDLLESEYGVFEEPKEPEEYHVSAECQGFCDSQEVTAESSQEAPVSPRPKNPLRGYHEDHRQRPKFKTGAANNNATNNGKRVPGAKRNNRVGGALKRYAAKLRLRSRRKGKNPKGAVTTAPSPAHKSKFLNEHLGELKNKTISFANKFFSLFTIIQFPNSRCQATSASSGYEGTCYHRSECEKANGTAIGDCANGYGVCCVFKYTCGDSSSRNCSYFESPGYPNYNPPDGSVVPPTIAPTMPPPVTPDPRLRDVFRLHLQRQARQDSVSTSLRCIFMIAKASPDVQQMRIDFEDMELLGPTNGTCINERLVITGQNVNDPIPVLCGYNTGQHVYVDVANLQGPLQIAVLAAAVQRKRFKIRVCQYSSSCSGNTNCLQYYTGLTGVISSFNYDQSAILSRSVPGYLNNLNYAICLRKEAGYCSVTYTNVQNRTEYPFELVNVDGMGQSIVPPGQAGAEIFNCPDDYIIVNGIRLCGYKLNDGSVIADFTMNAPVTDTSGGPIIIPVRTNNNVTGRGFKIFYTQNRCPPR